MSTFFNFHTAIALNKVEILDKLQDVITLHTLTVEDECLIFPNYTESSGGVYDERNLIRFIDVIYINDIPDYINIVIRSGHLHILSIHEPKRAYLNLHKELFYKSKLTLKEATDVVHNVWVQMDEALAKKQIERNDPLLIL